MDAKKLSLYIMSGFYFLAGINHFVHPSFYEKIMPPYLTYPLALIYLSGACETGLGLLLLPQKTRRFAAWGIIALLIAIFPANLQMLINYTHQHNPYTWVAILRLPFQLALILWAYVYVKKQ